MILYSHEKEIHSYLLFGLWQEFHDDIGRYLTNHELKTTTGEEKFIEWTKKKWEFNYEFDVNGTVIEASVSEDNYLLMVLKYSA